MEITKDKRKKLEIKAAQLIARKINEYLKTKDKIVLGVVGGSSVASIYGILKKQKVPWGRVHIFMADERLVPTNHPESNFKLVYDNFLEYLTKQKLLPLRNMHPYIYFNLPARQGVKAYKNELREISRCYDIVLLSSGEDGHVASLFPNHETIESTKDFFIATRSAPKSPKERISSSLKLLQKSKSCILLFFGDKKRMAYQNFKNKDLSIKDCPAKLINKIEDSYVFTDL